MDLLYKLPMTKLLPILALLLMCNNLFALTSNDYLRKGQLAEIKLQEVKALELYNKAIKLNPNNAEALSCAALLYSNIGSRKANNQQKEGFYKKAMKFATRSYKLEPTNANTNFAMAVIHGREVFMTSLPKAKIRWSAKMKKYADRAVKFDPMHKDAWALLGFWHYERATLTKIEKNIVGLLGGLPPGSIKQSIYCINKCKSIDKNHVMNLLTLGKVYKHLGKKEKAKSTWNIAINSKTIHFNDKLYKIEAKRRLSKI